MTTKKPKNIAASVRGRLLALARSRHEELELVLTRYALERLIYRLSRSRHRKDFVLKGAKLFTVWTGDPHRATRDLDLLGRGPNDIAHLENTFREVSVEQVDDDGVAFDARTIRGERIREDQEYEGVGLHIDARIGTARLALQVDVGFGDIVTPSPTEIEFPTLLDGPAPKLKAYSKEAVVAEKFHAMVVLGMANSRMKDFYDIWVLAQRFEFDGTALAAAIGATFEQRRTPMPATEPLALAPVFTGDEGKQKQWAAFIRRAGLRAERPPS